MGVVTIHVLSDAAQGSKAVMDYHCEVKLLLKHMQYFKPHLQDLAPGQDTEIAVQCNLVTFDWLMAYVKASITGVQPVLDCSNCISILVACSFLKMTQLVREAVQFIAANILRLAAAGADIAALDSALVTKIAKATSEEALEALLQQCEGVQLPRLMTPRSAGALSHTPAEAGSHSSSSSNELLQKLYKHKLEALLKQHNTTLLRCKACQQLFSAASHHKLQCPALAAAATESFMEAVHATAQCRGQGSSMAGLAAGNPAGGVLPGNTFSAAVVDAQ
ncbi:hypothetical protein OEZ85_006033 [Tetradesmus obliquus]|uniref:SANT and BTB domain-containing protein n=1 Tax=Tetradesmus obliquus TaxID=3088 RepID=A0ABY8UFP7_TETOB|nr:hypothetical protein OEZ85_006033 [Tetradesmus obliquus]